MERYKFPPVTYGWIPEYPELGRRIKLRPGQSLAWVGRMADIPDQIYLDGVGVTHLIQNPGLDIEASAGANQRAVIVNEEELLNKLKQYSTTDILSWATPDAKSTINNHVDEEFSNPPRKSGFVIDEAYEKLGYVGVASELQSAWNESVANETYGRALQAKLTSLNINGKFYGGYDGHMSGDRITLNINGFSIDAGRKLLKWEPSITLNPPGQPSVTLPPVEIVKRLTPFGNTFYSKSAYLFRHGAIKIYGKGEPDIFKMSMGFLIGLEIDRIARLKLEINRRVAVAAFPGYNETLKSTDPDDTRKDYRVWSVKYARTFSLPGGQTKVVRTTFPMWSYSIQIGLYFLTFAMDFDFYSWESGERFGRNETVVPITQGPNAYQSTQLTTQGQAPTQAGPRRAGEAPTNSAVMYAANPQGCMDLPLVAADMYTFINQFAGFNGEWARHRVKKAGDSVFSNYTVVAPDYLIDRYEAGATNNPTLVSPGMAMRFVEDNKRGLFYINMHLAAGQSEFVEVDLGGVTHQFQAYGGVPYCFRRTLP